MTDLSSLFIVCSHGRRSAHEFAPEWCPGGRPATLWDLEELGQRINWCEVHDSVQSLDVTGCEAWWLIEKGYSNVQCAFTERILIPLPQMVAGESL